MAGILQTVFNTGNTLYATIRRLSDGAIWNGSSFEAYNGSNWSTYDIALTEDGSSGYYKATFPAGLTTVSKYTIVIYQQSGGSPAEGDQVVGVGNVVWDGTSEEPGNLDDIADAVLDEVLSGHTTAGTLGQRLQVIRANTAQSGAAGYIQLDSGASASDDFYNNQIVHIIGGTGAGQSRVISDYTGSSQQADVDTNWVTNPASDSVFVIYPFGSIPGATAPTAAQNADAVWDELRADHTDAGSFGEGVKVESLNTQAKADVDAECDEALAAIDLDHLINSSFGSNPAIGSLMDLIMNKNSGQTFSQATDSLEGIKDTGSGPTAGQIADAVWDEALGSGVHDTANTAGERVQAIDNKLPSGSISDFDESANPVNLNADQSGATVGTVNSLGTTAVGQVNAEMVDVMSTDVIAELSAGAPPTNPTVVQALMLLYMALRNKRTTSTSETKIFNAAGTNVAKATVTDSGSEFVKNNFGAP